MATHTDPVGMTQGLRLLLSGDIQGVMYRCVLARILT